jgi:hypothetical protein
MPGSGPADGSERLAGVRRCSQGEWEPLAAQVGTHHLDPILDEPNLVLGPMPKSGVQERGIS